MEKYTNILDIATTFLLLTIIFVYVVWLKNRHADDAAYNYYIPSFLLHLLGGFGFAAFYLNTGGDTQAYYSGAISLKDLFYRDTPGYFAELFSSPQNHSIFTHFNYHSGLPPTWIYQEAESWMVSKIYSIPAILGISGYFGLTTIVAFASHSSAFFLFRELYLRNIHKKLPLMLAILAVPSVLFWTSGISKDTLLEIGLTAVTAYYFRMLRAGFRAGTFFWIVFFSYLFLFSIRNIMLVSAFLSGVYSFSRSWLRSSRVSDLSKTAIRAGTFVAMVSVVTLIFTNGSFLESSALNEVVAEAEITHNDFTQNKTYGESRYQIEVTEFSLPGMVASMPASIVAGLYRPFLWESLSPAFILNGIESTVLITLTLRVILFRKRRKLFRYLFRNEILSYLIISALFIAFFSGFSSILFGVLVRIRSFALPFFAAVLLAEPDQLEVQQRKTLVEEDF